MIIQDRINALNLLDDDSRFDENSFIPQLTNELINAIEVGKKFIISTVDLKESPSSRFDSPVRQTTYMSAILKSIKIFEEKGVRIANREAMINYMIHSPSDETTWLYEPVNDLDNTNRYRDLSNEHLDLMVSIDVTANDDTINESIKTLIKEHRKKKEIAEKIELNKKGSNRYQLEKYKVIPILDLYLLAKAKGVKLKHKQVVNIVFNDEMSVDTDSLRNIIKRHIKPLLKPTYHRKIRYDLMNSMLSKNIQPKEY